MTKIDDVPLPMSNIWLVQGAKKEQKKQKSESFFPFFVNFSSFPCRFSAQYQIGKFLWDHQYTSRNSVTLSSSLTIILHFSIFSIVLSIQFLYFISSILLVFCQLFQLEMISCHESLYIIHIRKETRAKKVAFASKSTNTKREQKVHMKHLKWFSVQKL